MKWLVISNESGVMTEAGAKSCSGWWQAIEVGGRQEMKHRVAEAGDKRQKGAG